ncbi:MAG: hypothetical protein CR986_08600 [Ignavibacteriae bacterium]|nr:MAG: hypothetical protein CR986_08600 [Ignavibacteriota bacterium]
MKTINKLLLLMFLSFYGFLSAQEVVNLELPLKEKNLPFGLIQKVSEYKPKVCLALSGGGSRGIVHLGVIKALVEEGIPIEYIVGTSMGSVVGGLFSAGYSLNDLDSIITNINWEELFFVTSEDRRNLFVDQKITEDKALFTIRLDGVTPVIPQAINTGKKISNLLTNLTLNAPLNEIKNFNKLLYKFRAVTTELISGKRIVLNSGSLSEAMRASSSVSFLLPPIEIDSLVLVDGGIVDNLPIASAEELNPDMLIASDVTSPLKTRENIIYPWDIADQLVTIPSRKLWEENKDKADILLDLSNLERSNNNFSNITELIEFGYQYTKNNIERIKKELLRKYFEKINSDNTKFYNLRLNNNPNDVEKKIYLKLKDKPYLTKADILFELSKMNETGIFANLSANLKCSEETILTINYKLNPKIKKINIYGITLLTDNDINKFFKDLRNKPYSSPEILKSALNLIRYYRNNKYMLTNINRIFYDKASQELNIYIDENKISDIIFDRNLRTIPPVIEREFSNLLNTHLRSDAFNESLQNLSATDLFDNIVVSFKKDSMANKNLELKLDEKLPNVLRFGVRFDNENYTQAALDIRNENLFGNGSELGVSLAGGKRNMNLVLEHKSNRIFDTYLTYKAQVFYKFNDVNIYKDDNSEFVDRFSRSKISEYMQKFYGGFIGVGAHLKKIGTLTTELKYETNIIKGLTNYAKKNEYDKNITSIKLRLQIDSQNKYPYPTKGIFINTYYETAQEALGSDVSFAKFSFNYIGHFTIANRHTIQPKFIFGFADNTLPLSQHFNFGGQNNFMGYREFEFRGRQILITSIAYRYKIPINILFDTYFSFRYDLGSSWSKQEKIKLKYLKHGFGLTLSVNTPIGRADFSVGKSLYLKDTSPERILSKGPYVFYFTFGYYY